MKKAYAIVVGMAMCVASQSGLAGSISDTYTDGDTLTATTLNNIKSAVNDNDTQISTLQTRVSGSCPAGQSIRVINANGTVSCEVDSDTTYSAGTGIDISGTTITQLGGIATTTANNVTLGSSNSDVTSITFTAPAAGYVHAYATGIIQASGMDGIGYAAVTVGVSDTSLSLPTGNYVYFYRSADTTGTVSLPYAAQGVFPVTAGSNTIYLVGVSNGTAGTGQLNQNRLTVTYHAQTM